MPVHVNDVCTSASSAYWWFTNTFWMHVFRRGDELPRSPTPPQAPPPSNPATPMRSAPPPPAATLHDRPAGVAQPPPPMTPTALLVPGGAYVAAPWPPQTPPLSAPATSSQLVFHAPAGVE